MRTSPAAGRKRLGAVVTGAGFSCARGSPPRRRPGLSPKRLPTGPGTDGTPASCATTGLAKKAAARTSFTVKEVRRLEGDTRRRPLRKASQPEQGGPGLPRFFRWKWWRRRELNPRPEASRERLLHAQPLLGSRPPASR